MSPFIKDLMDYLARELAVAIDSTGHSLRVFFAGPPQAVLEELFQALIAEHGAFRIKVRNDWLHVPIYLIDSHAQDPTDGVQAGRCTSSYLVQIRNLGLPTFFAMHCVGEAINASLDTASKPLGIRREIPDLSAWLETSLVSELLEKAIQRLALGGPREKVDVAVRHALAEAWEADDRHQDKRNAWEVIRRLSNLQLASGSPHEALAAALGLPACPEHEFGSADHLKVLARVSDLFEAHGLARALDSLEEIAGDDLLPHVRGMRQHIEMRCVEAGEFARRSLQTYSPIDGIDATEIPIWWRGLTVDAWSRLLDGGSEDEPTGKLNVECGNLIAPTLRGMPMLVRDHVELTITVGGAQSAVDLVISRASGNARLDEVARIPSTGEEPVAWDDRDIPKHDRFVRYRIEADGYAPKTLKFIILDQYQPGIVAYCRGAAKGTPFKLNKKAKDTSNRTIERYECELQLQGMGSHQVDLYTSRCAVLPYMIRGHEIDAEQTGIIERQINRVDANHSICLLETDEECYYEFDAKPDGGGVSKLFRIDICADEVSPTGATSEFDRLVIEHRAAARREQANARVEPTTCRAMNLEEWALEDEQSFRPLAFGPDYLNEWRKPNWQKHSIFSAHTMVVDPRPDPSELDPPTAFLDARRELLAKLNRGPDEPTPSAGMLRLYEHMRDEHFAVSLHNFLDAYLAWLDADYDRAAWVDLVGIHATQSTGSALEAVPYAIMLSPLHPIRLAWQCRAQEVLQQALDEHARCPAASMLSPTTFPDCMMLPCKTATGKVLRRPYAAMASSSDYWGVLWSVEALGHLSKSSSDPVFGSELGIWVEGLSTGFSAQQVVRSMDEVSRLLSAKSTLRVSVTSDTSGSSSCNEGIDNWCSATLGPEGDCWHDAGPRSLVVIDERDESLQPEQAVLASLTSRTGAAVRWFTQKADEAPKHSDLAIIAHLGTINHEFQQENLRSTADPSALTRWRVRKQLAGANAAFIAESRIGEIPTTIDVESLAGRLLHCVDAIERRCRDVFDSYVFAPNMTALKGSVERSRYCAVSSSNVDVACFFGSTGRAYLWDYELPSYARRAGENSGYFLLATQSPGILLAVRSALELLAGDNQLRDQQVASLLDEVSRRGLPTLKRLTSGGAMSLGEVGMLVAMRVLQSEFELPAGRPRLFPACSDDGTVNLVIPADPFRNHFDDLRVALENKHGERPDLLLASIQLASGTPLQLRLTPLEVKARGSSRMSDRERREALSQASLFADFLFRVQARALESELWAIAWRNLVTSLLDYGFRVYGQLDGFMQRDEWAQLHGSTFRSLANGELEVEVDRRGRLLIVDTTNSSGPADVDGDGFHETIVLSHEDAFAALADGNGSLVDNIGNHLGDWQLRPVPVTRAYNPDAPTHKGPAQSPSLPSLSTSLEQLDTGNASLSNASRPDATMQSDARFGDPDRFDVGIGDSTIASQSTTLELSSGQSEAQPQPEFCGELPAGIRFRVGETRHEFHRQDVFFSPGDTALNQLNVGVVGDLGTGKTQLIQALVHQLRLNPDMNRGHRPNVLIFDYKKDYSKVGFVKATGARVVQPFDIPLNLFDTRDSLQRRNAWLERSKFFSDVLDKLYTGIGPAQRQRIKSAVKESYEQAVHTGREAPTIHDVFDAYARVCGDKIDSPYSIMSDLVDGGYFVSDPAKVIPFSEFLNKVVVIDLADVGQDDRTKNMLVVTFLNLFYEHMLRIPKREFLGNDQQSRFIDTILLVDEADNIMKYEFDVLKKILLQGREFGVGALLASQYLSHFRTSHENYLEPLLTWFVHKVPNISIKELEGIGLTGVSADTVDKVKSLGCHECLFKTLGVGGKVVRATPFFELTTSTNR